MRSFKTVLMLMIGLLAVLPACQGGDSTVRLTTSQDIPAAQGAVKMSTSENRNTRLTVEVQHLAPPARITDSATAYVVWARSVEPHSPVQNLGGLVVDKDLNGRLEAVTPHRVFDLFITAEPSATVAAPTGKDLLSARINRK